MRTEEFQLIGPMDLELGLLGPQGLVPLCSCGIPATVILAGKTICSGCCQKLMTALADWC